MFQELKRKKVITEKEKNYFKFNFKNVTNVGKLYLPPKINKRLSNVPGQDTLSFKTVVPSQKKFQNT